MIWQNVAGKEVIKAGRCPVSTWSSLQLSLQRGPRWRSVSIHKKGVWNTVELIVLQRQAEIRCRVTQESFVGVLVLSLSPSVSLSSKFQKLYEPLPCSSHGDATAPFPRMYIVLNTHEMVRRALSTG